MNAFLQKLINPFVNFWENDLKPGLAKFVPEIEAVAENFVAGAVAAFEDVLRVGTPMAIEAILNEAPKTISGTEKFGNAVTNVAQQLQVQLGPVAMGDVQALVQTVYRGVEGVATDIRTNGNAAAAGS